MSEADPRHVRQVLLGEIGERGQRALSAARYRVEPDTEPGVARVIRMYLGRAGLAESSDGRPVVTTPATASPAEAYLRGALAAVEHIKSELGIGVPMGPEKLAQEP